MAELGVRIRCTFCHDGLEPGTAVHCASCLAPHHAECQATHGRCAAPGCDDARVLVPDPAGRAAHARPRVTTTGKKAPIRVRWRRVGGLALALGLTALGAAALWPRELAPIAPPPVIPAPVVVRAASPQQQPRLVHEGPAAGVSLVARDFHLPAVLAEGERLVVSTGDRGYTHVVRESPRGARTCMVAEPGDTIDVITGPRERLRAGPGEAIVVERAGDETVRVLVVPAS